MDVRFEIPLGVARWTRGVLLSAKTSEMRKFARTPQHRGSFGSPCGHCPRPPDPLPRRERTRKMGRRSRRVELPHADSQTNFIFFNADRRQTELASAFRAKGIEIGRTFQPFTPTGPASLSVSQREISSLSNNCAGFCGISRSEPTGRPRIAFRDSMSFLFLQSIFGRFFLRGNGVM